MEISWTIFKTSFQENAWRNYKRTPMNKINISLKNFIWKSSGTLTILREIYG